MVNETVDGSAGSAFKPRPRKAPVRRCRRLCHGLILQAVLLCLEPAGAREVVGWIEPIQLEPEGPQLTAKLDTGADSSSLGATAIEVYSADGIERVRFRIQARSDERSTVDLPLERIAKIKRHVEGAETRPVVRLRICLGNLRKEVEVNLADRSNYEQPVLIGRDFLSSDLIVDPAETFTTSPRCDSARGWEETRK